MRHTPVQRSFAAHLLPPGKHGRLFSIQEDGCWEAEEESQLKTTCKQPQRQRRGRRQRLRMLRSLYTRFYKRTISLPFYWKIWGSLGGRRRRLGAKRREGGGGSAGMEVGKAQRLGPMDHIAEEDTGSTRGLPNGFSPLPTESETILITNVCSIGTPEGLAPNGPHNQGGLSPAVEKEVPAPALTEEHVACVQSESIHYRAPHFTLMPPVNGGREWRCPPPLYWCHSLLWGCSVRHTEVNEALDQCALYCSIQMVAPCSPSGRTSLHSPPELQQRF